MTCGPTSRGAVASMLTGSLSAVVLIFLSPTIQVDLLGHASALFPLKSPALVTMPLSFITGILASLLAPEPDAEACFAEVHHRMHVGQGASAPTPAAVPASAPEPAPTRGA